MLLDVKDGDYISIHTPTRGVTSYETVTINYKDISIHTPTRGVTDALVARILADYDFNPHSHKGSDCTDTWDWKEAVISIHTPTRGVT